MKTLIKTIVAVMVVAASSSAVVISGNSLQNELNAITTGGVSSVDVQNDQMEFDEIWKLTASGAGFHTIVLELTTSAATNAFGIFDAADHTNVVQIFTGSETVGNKHILEIYDDGRVDLDFSTVGNFGSTTFGYYLNNGSNTFYSAADYNVGGVDQFVAYRGENDEIKLPSKPASIWTPDEYVLAFEDGIDGDNDFDDMVVFVESVTPVPEPATLGMLGLGLIAISFAVRRKKSA